MKVECIFFDAIYKIKLQKTMFKKILCRFFFILLFIVAVQ